jgi:hypothetical protein
MIRSSWVLAMVTAILFGGMTALATMETLLVIEPTKEQPRNSDAQAKKVPDTFNFPQSK